MGYLRGQKGKKENCLKTEYAFPIIYAIRSTLVFYKIHSSNIYTYEYVQPYE